jgi:transmembrane 9 superfamily protein 2/4
LSLCIEDDYYNPKFHFCEPEGGPKKQPESLGSILFGDRIFNSPYDVCPIPDPCQVHINWPIQIKMLEKNPTCKTLCTVRDVPGEDAKFINDRIREDYALNWLVDGLPAAEMKVDLRTHELFFDKGFNLGNNEPPHTNKAPVLNNHYEIVLRFALLSSPYIFFPMFCS